MKCCICGGEIEVLRNKKGDIFWDTGNNALPIKDGRCCEKCNIKVIQRRISDICKNNFNMTRRKENLEEKK